MPNPYEKSAAQHLLPQPFAWIEIPGGSVTISNGDTFELEAFKIAKYPVTNAQYSKFVEAGGYHTRRWWTEKGWKTHGENRSHRRPRLDAPLWNGLHQPVIDVTWYEASAFCQWLGDATSTQVVLPTEAQWQRAAQGDERRKYPWGDEWDILRCNNGQQVQRFGGLFGIGGRAVRPNVAGQGKRTTPVTAYEGLGDSPFGVVDMVGNVYEWCFDEYRSKYHFMGGEVRLMRGGSWDFGGSASCRCDHRNYHWPNVLNNDLGFRPAFVA